MKGSFTALFAPLCLPIDFLQSFTCSWCAKGKGSLKAFEGQSSLVLRLYVSVLDSPAELDLLLVREGQGSSKALKARVSSFCASMSL